MIEKPRVDNYQINGSGLDATNDNSTAVSSQENNFSNNQSSSNEIKITQLLNKRYLLNLYINKLRQIDLFAQGIKKFEILDKENYENKDLYDQAARKLAYKIKITKTNSNQKNRDLNSNLPNMMGEDWIIQSKITDKKKWEDLIGFVEIEANKEIQSFLIKIHNEILLNNKELKKFQIETIDEKIQIELKNYENQIKSKILFLSEQAKIARKLDVAKNNLIESQQTFTADTGIISNITTEIPYYMRGYEMIEKEIELISSRKNKKAFSSEIIGLQNAKNKINSDRDINRLNQLFYKTPVMTKNFYAAKNLLETTSFKPVNITLVKFLTLAGVIGMLIGIINVLFVNVLQNRK